MKRIDKLWIRPKGQNGLELHPKAKIEECMKSYEKRVGICIKEVDVLSIFHKLECVKLSISAHPDCVEHSEFEDMAETLNEIKELIIKSI